MEHFAYVEVRHERWVSQQVPLKCNSCASCSVVVGRVALPVAERTEEQVYARRCNVDTMVEESRFLEGAIPICVHPEKKHPTTALCVEVPVEGAVITKEVAKFCKSYIMMAADQLKRVRA